jgi:peroxiredoxin
MEHDMPLAPELNAFKERWTERVGPETAKMMSNDIAGQLPMIEKVLKVGDLFPSVTLTDHLNRPFDIAASANLQPLVVTFYRGGWCPYCNLELRAYQKILPAIEQRGARLVAVSPETPDNSLTTAQKNELTFAVLSDANGTLADALGIRYRLSEPVKAYFRSAGLDLPARNGDGGWSLPIPATYVVARGGHIALAHLDPDYRKRVEPQTVLQALQALPAAA